MALRRSRRLAYAYLCPRTPCAAGSLPAGYGNAARAALLMRGSSTHSASRSRQVSAGRERCCPARLGFEAREVYMSTGFSFGSGTLGSTTAAVSPLGRERLGNRTFSPSWAGSPSPPTPRSFLVSRSSLFTLASFPVWLESLSVAPVPGPSAAW
ncbi:hypothetical protein P7K49_012343 [Saguinus oedipus]|uniref:Uncharacterized protein n=1 Tax=Saguinus oedipus TaxID=9490 RepID=A0ABQ9VTX0_SAGOE|nr:hypothetical protein P7K49_012343 [Saguinus oedipus]